MRVPMFFTPGTFGVHKINKVSALNTTSQNTNQPKSDTVSFSSTAKYLKKYTTLPDEIKEILTPADAIDMFKDMEMVAKGKVKRTKIGQGNSSSVLEIPWLENYCMILLRDDDLQSQTIYSRVGLGDAVWYDKDNSKIQIIKKTA